MEMEAVGEEDEVERLQSLCHHAEVVSGSSGAKVRMA